MRRTFTTVAMASTAMGTCLASALWAQQPVPVAPQPVPGAVRTAPGTPVPSPSAVQPAPGTAQPVPGAVPPAPGTSQPLPGTVRTVPGSAQPLPGAQPPAASSPLPPRAPLNDRLFAAAAAVSGLAEVTTSNLAAQRASDDEVRKFAQHMVTDHTRANQELLGVAAAKGFGLPQALEITHQADYDVLNGLQGAEFDRAYIRQQVAAHICAVGLFEAESQRGLDGDLRAWAGKTLPALREHLNQARRLMREGNEGQAATKDAHDHEGDDRPAAPSPRVDRPGADRPDPDRPAADRPGADRPGADRAKGADRTKGADRPDADRPKGADRSKDDDRSQDDDDQPK